MNSIPRSTVYEKPREGTMKSINKLGLHIVATILILSTLSCSLPAIISFPTPTPSPTNTPTKTLTPSPTDTPVPTNTPTPAPPPPISLLGCTYQECPPSKTISDYLGTDQIPSYSTISILYTDAVRFFYAWCTKSRTTLDANLENIQFIFDVDNVSFLNFLKGEYYTTQDPQDSSVTESCYGMGGVASDWVVGQSHRVKMGIFINAMINDGWQDYPAGTNYQNSYLIVPKEPATPTSLPSPTNTPPPTVQSNDYVPPAVSCMVNSNIIIQNRTGSPFTIYLTGPGSFTFNLGSDAYSTVRVCSGTYNYTIYGTCNGQAASGSGRISDGDQVYFACR
jgi:hypothetical protein